MSSINRSQSTEKSQGQSRNGWLWDTDWLLAKPDTDAMGLWAHWIYELNPLSDVLNLNFFLSIQLTI